MLIIISNRALISEIPTDLKIQIKDLLTIVNPLFFKRIDLGLSTWGIRSNLLFYENFSKESIIVPVGVIPKIIDLATKLGITDISIIDNRTTNVYPDFFDKIVFYGQLRDYQQKIVDICMEKTIGVIEAMTGSGKTITFIALILKRKEPTLILVHTLELAHQTISSFLKFTNLKEKDIGFIGDGKWDVKPITVALHQTMAKLSKKHFSILNEKFGQVIADEVHIVGAHTYFHTMTNLSAKYKFGFTATPHRDDGLTDVIHFATGPKIFTVPISELKDVLIKPKIVTVNTNYTFPIFSSNEYQSLISDLSENDERNNLIVDTANSDSYKDKTMCFLCVRISQVYRLKEKLGEEAEVLTSETPKKERKKIMNKLLNGECKKIISTYALFSTGIDIPQLDLILLCAPIQSETKLKQTAGRLMRKANNKTEAILIDFVDKNVSILKNQFYKRNKIYKKLWSEK